MGLLTLYHYTHRKNVRSIRRVGLHPSYARTKDGCIYACQTAAKLWAEVHTCSRHKWRPEHLVCLVVYVRSEDVRKSHLRGVFRTDRVIPPGRLWMLSPVRASRSRPARRRSLPRSSVQCRRGSGRER